MSLRSLALTASALGAFLITLTACGGGGKADPLPAARVQTIAETAVSAGLAGVVIEHVTLEDSTQALAGVRQLGATAKVQAGDAFMIGSTTKAMTAALAGRLVEGGQIAWTTTLAQALPDLAAGMQPAYRSTTLEQLLSHRGGLLAFTTNVDAERFEAHLQSAGDTLPTTQAGRERFFAAWLLAQDPPPQVTPGQTYFYSNAGYAMAALMLEARTGRPFAELFEQELAKPLGMTVSWTSSDQVLTQGPAGHEGVKGKLAVVAPLDADTAAWVDVLRAGGLGTTLTPASYATWVRWHLRALSGAATPLAAGYLQRIKGLNAGDYALGWVAADIDGRAVLTHDGQVRGFSSLLFVDMRGRSASFAFTNTAADDGMWVHNALNQAMRDTERSLPPK